MSIIPSKVIIINPNAIEIQRIQNMVTFHFAHLHIVGQHQTIQAGMLAIMHTHPNIVFLEWQPDDIDLIEWQQLAFTYQFELIVTAAKTEYAAQAIKLHAAGYLLHPLKQQDLAIVLQYLLRKQHLLNYSHLAMEYSNSHLLQAPLGKLALSTQHEVEFVNISEIIRCESFRNYTTFHLTDKRTITTSKSLGEYEKILLPNHFIRVHKSYLVNMIYVKKFIKTDGGQLLMSDGQLIDVSNNKREELMSRLSMMSAA